MEAPPRRVPPYRTGPRRKKGTFDCCGRLLRVGAGHAGPRGARPLPGPMQSTTTSVFGPCFLFFLLVGWIFFLLRFFPNRGHAGGGLSDCIFLFFQGYPCKLDCNHHILLMKYFPISQKKKRKENLRSVWIHILNFRSNV